MPFSCVWGGGEQEVRQAMVGFSNEKWQGFPIKYRENNGIARLGWVKNPVFFPIIGMRYQVAKLQEFFHHH